MHDSAQQARPFIPQVDPRGQTGTLTPRAAQPPTQMTVGGAAHVGALRDATIAEADTEEALAAATALWTVLSQQWDETLVRGTPGSPQ